MRKTAPIVALLAALAVASSASAQDITSEPLVQRDLAAAGFFWHRPVNCTIYTVETGPSIALAQTELYGCTQTWNVETWQWFDEAYEQPANAKPRWPGDNPPRRRIEYLRWSCVLTLHEFGHSLGLPDQTTNPKGIMYRASGPGGPTPGICQRLFP